MGLQATLQDGGQMKFLVLLVFGGGFLVLAGMALSFLLRFLLLQWGVGLVGRVAQSILRWIGGVLHAVISIFGVALVGAFIGGLGLQIGMTFIIGGVNDAVDPTMPILIAFLSFFVIVAVRGWQWRARRNGKKAGALARSEISDATEVSELADYPAGYENVAVAWRQAITLAPRHRDDLLAARATCAGLVAAVEKHDGIPDSAMTDTATLIRNHLAAWVDSTKRRLLGAKPSEKKAIIEEMVRFLRGFAQRAQWDMRASDLSANEEDMASRAHLAAQLFKRGNRKRVANL